MPAQTASLTTLQSYLHSYGVLMYWVESLVGAPEARAACRETQLQQQPASLVWLHVVLQFLLLTVLPAAAPSPGLYWQ